MKDTRLCFTFMAGNFIWRRRGGPEGPIIFGLRRRQTVQADRRCSSVADSRTIRPAHISQIPSERSLLLVLPSICRMEFLARFGCGISARNR